MFENQSTFLMVFIFHLIILLGKAALNEETTENWILFNLHMLMSSNLKKKHILKRAPYVHS